MVRKNLASLAVAASLLATSAAGIAFAKGPEEGRGFPGKGMDIRAEHRAGIAMKKSAASMPELTLCTFTALDKKETSEITAHEAFDAGMKVALSTRKTSVTAALALTDATARKEALKKAQDEFKKATKTLNETMRKAQRTSQKTFKTERKACGSTTTPSTQS